MDASGEEGHGKQLITVPMGWTRFEPPTPVFPRHCMIKGPSSPYNSSSSIIGSLTSSEGALHLSQGVVAAAEAGSDHLRGSPASLALLQDTSCLEVVASHLQELVRCVES
jgi:hypothetical protein